MTRDPEQVHTEFVASTATYIVVTALSHTGLVRDHNEDSLVIGQWTLCAAETETAQTLVFPIANPLVVAVADGLGGHPGGDVASSLVVRELARAAPILDSELRLRDVLNACNRALYGIASDQPMLMAMGTTVAGVLLTSDQVFAFNVGDSRVYTHGPDGLRQVSVDDSPPLAPGQDTPLSSRKPSVEDSPTRTLNHMCRHFCSRPRCDGLSAVMDSPTWYATRP